MEKQHRIKKIIIRRKDDFITALEKNWRDQLSKPITDLFLRLKISANHITYSGFALIFIAIIMHFLNCCLLWQIIILTLAALTDSLDGSTARNNNDISIRGTWLDHIRDGLLMVWTSYLIYFYRLLSPQILFIIWALQLVLVWICLKDFVWRYLNSVSDSHTEILLENFSLDNLQASVIGRLQFFCWTTGYGFLFLSLLIDKPALISIGQALIAIEIIFTGLNILESYQKTGIINE